MYPALGQTRVAVLTCPHCSYLSGGECLICANDDPHPACEGCVDGRLPKRKWYQGDLAIAIFTATIVSVSTGIIVRQLTKRTKVLK